MHNVISYKSNWLRLHITWRLLNVLGLKTIEKETEIGNAESMAPVSLTKPFQSVMVCLINETLIETSRQVQHQCKICNGIQHVLGPKKKPEKRREDENKNRLDYETK